MTCTSQHNSALYHTCYRYTLYFLPSKLISTHCKINVERLNSFESELVFLSCSNNNLRQVNFKCFHENDISVFFINNEYCMILIQILIDFFLITTYKNRLHLTKPKTAIRILKTLVEFIFKAPDQISYN